MLECDRKCVDLLREALKNPPRNTKVAIHIGYCKARYSCPKGNEVRTCKGGRWTGKKAPKCSGISRALLVPCTCTDFFSSIDALAL